MFECRAKAAWQSAILSGSGNRTQPINPHTRFQLPFGGWAVKLLAGGALAASLPALGQSAGRSSGATEPIGGRETALIAQEIPVAKPAFRFVPGIDLQARYTDNVTLASSDLAKGDWVTDTAATINAEYRRRSAEWSVDFRIDKLFHEQFENLDATQRTLKTVAKIEPVEKLLTIDARGDIGQQNRSIFGIAGLADIASITKNQIETSSYRVAPTLRGDLGSTASYSISTSASELRTGDVNFPDSKSREWTGSLKSAKSGGLLGWTLEGNRLTIENDAVQKRQDSRFRAGLTFTVDQQLHFSVGTGREYADLDGKERTVSSTPGFGIEWSPGTRTQFAALSQRRFFGNDHLVVFAHRTAMTTWRFSSSKEIAIPSNEPASSNPFSVNNLLLNLLAASIPEGAEKLEEVQKKFAETGVPSISGIRGGVLFIRPLLSTRHNLAIGVKGLRNTITAEVERREQRALDGSGDSSPGVVAPVQDVRQTSVNLTWAYRLSRNASIRYNGSYLLTEGIGTSLQSTTQRYQSLSLVTQLSERLTHSASLQRSRTDSTVVGTSRENSFTTGFTYRF